MSRILKAFVENEGAIRRYLSKFSLSVQDIEDYVQEVFVRGFAAEIRAEIHEPKAFLFRIAKNLALADIRKNKGSPTHKLEDLGGAEIVLDEGQPAPDDRLDGRRKLALFTAAVAHLPPKCRKAFMLRRIDGLQYKQIANRLDISVSAVEKHVATGLMKCNAYLREHGYEPSEFGAVVKAQKPSSDADCL